MRNMADTIKRFEGFPPGKFHMTGIPSPFFTDLLPLLDDLAELKVLLFCFWALPQKEGTHRYLRQHDFTTNQALMAGLAVTAPEHAPDEILNRALDRAVQRGALLSVDVSGASDTETLYFANTAAGRAAVTSIQQGQYTPGDADNPVEILPERPTIYSLYEENIGALTPIIADELKDIEKEFPAQWAQEAFHIAVRANKRSLRYIRAILERWQTEGRTEERGTGETEKNGEWYISGKYSDFIER